MSRINIEREEPGVVRNWVGRIVSTGYPYVDSSEWPKACQEIEKLVWEQLDYERMLITGLTTGLSRMDEWGNILTNNEGVFKLGSRELLPYVQDSLDELMELQDFVSVCDVGGGNGKLLEDATLPWKTPRPENTFTPSRLHTILTTLIEHDPINLNGRKIAGVIDEVRHMAIEAPHNDLFESCDLIIASNSVYYWSALPELTTVNLLKMLKSGGRIIATVPVRPYPVYRNTKFNAHEYLQSQVSWNYRELGILNVGMLASAAIEITPCVM